MLANMFIFPQASIMKKLGVFLRQTRDDLIKRARHENLVGLGKVHHALGNVNPIANSIELAVDVFQQLDWAKIDPYTEEEWYRLGVALLAQSITQIEQGLQGVLRVSHKAQRGPVSGIQDETIRRRHALNSPSN